MPQGTRKRIGRVAVVGLGVVLCSGLVGCLGDSGPKKPSLPPAKAKQEWNTTVSPPPGQPGATQPTRPGTAAQPGAAAGANAYGQPQPGANTYVQPQTSANTYGQPQPGFTPAMGTPTRQNNAAVMSPYPPAGGNALVPSVSPYQTGVQPAGGTMPQPNMSMSQYPGNTLSPARVSQESVPVNAGFHTSAPATPTLLDMPTPPAAPAAFAPPVGPATPVTTPTAPLSSTFPSAPEAPRAPIAP